MFSFIIGVLFATSVCEVFSSEVQVFKVSNETELDESKRFLDFGLSAAAKTTCMNRILKPSSVFPGLSITTLTKLQNGKIYYFSPTTAVFLTPSWQSAKLFCSEHGMHLVTLNNAVENMLVYNRALTLGIIAIPPGVGVGAFIGLHDTTGTNVWGWVQNTKIRTPFFFKLENLPAAGQCGAYTIGVATTTVATSWVSVPCTTGAARAFICELEPPCSQLITPDINAK